jgi:Leucine-rich repeat (LRR) protein
LTALQTLQFTGHIGEIEEEAFKDLTSLVELRISGPKFEKLLNMFSNCKSLRKLILRDSDISVIAGDAFEEIPFLEKLDLTNSRKLSTIGIGSSLQMLKNPKVKILLDNTKVKSLEESVFHSLIEMFVSSQSKTGQISGYISLSKVALNCGCDVKWILDSLYTHIFKCTTCVGKSRNSGHSWANDLKYVDLAFLEKWCPK